MPNITENKDWWDSYQWEKFGEEWSEAWGGAKMQWFGSILPRIHKFIPAQSILEIACGHGRWTNFLKDYCEKLIAVDLSEKSINYCKEKFEETKISFHLNDGKSLHMVPEQSIDFIFSLDSLVHVDRDVIGVYLSQFSKILKKDGVVFIHHSNLGEYRYYSYLDKTPFIKKVFGKIGIIEKKTHWRDPSVSAKDVKILAENYGLRCLHQELVNWGTKGVFFDCFSVMVRKDSSFIGEFQKLQNKNFMQEANNIKLLSKLYNLN